MPANSGKTSKSKPKPKQEIRLGPVIVDNADVPERMAILLWGLAGCGKSVLAATAPGLKLWLVIGDNEHQSVKHRKDVRVANMSGLTLEQLFDQMQNDDPFGLDRVLMDNEEITTVVLDSVTALTFRALQKAVKDGIGGSAKFKPTMAFPGQSAYGGRNGIVLECLTGLLRVTAKYGVHIIITAHEADPTFVKGKEGEGIIDYIGVMLGGQLVSNMSLRLSEIWHLRQSPTGERERILSIRPTANRRPMKTRMFRGDQSPSFTLKYNAFKPDAGQLTINSIWEQWLKGNMEHMDVPK